MCGVVVSPSADCSQQYAMQQAKRYLASQCLTVHIPRLLALLCKILLWIASESVDAPCDICSEPCSRLQLDWPGG